MAIDTNTLAAVTALTMAWAAPTATAQPGPATIEAAADKPYRFRHSGLVVPATLDDLPRTEIKAYSADELDLSANYVRGNEYLTVYVFRNVTGGVPVWFDRARWAVENRGDAFGTATRAIDPVAFTPPGQSSASGLMGAWSVTKPPLRGTALAILPMGDWYVKIRYSSVTHDGAALAARLPAVLAALQWPKATGASAAAAPVADCATALSFPTTAEPVRDPKALSMAAVASGLVAAAAAKKRTDATPVAWCRDPGPAPVGGIYRANGATDAYLLAISDAGRGIWVTPDVIGQEVAAKEGKTVRQWSIALHDIGDVTSYPPMTALPRPDQIVDVLRGRSLSRVTTWGDKPQININSAFLNGGTQKKPASK